MSVEATCSCRGAFSSADLCSEARIPGNPEIGPLAVDITQDEKENISLGGQRRKTPSGFAHADMVWFLRKSKK